MKNFGWIILLSLLPFAENACTQTNKNSDKYNKTEKKMKTKHLNKAEFLSKVVNYEENAKEWKYLGDKPAIIDFYASWCGPCKMIAPVLEELAAQYEEKIHIYKIDTEEEQELAAVFNIRSIPTLLFIPMQGPPQMASGAMSKAQLEEAIKNVLLNH
ncbi:MAG: thioredoxin [Dysgonamonadaceae bacterium]|jgi:thioredoxin|nr:thioredoxin [Dysgonamonadaceae bacterium]